jgi:hypothetical protein
MLQDIATSSSILDSKGGVVISKWESSDQKSDSESLDISQGAISKNKGSKQSIQKPKKSDLYCTHCKKKYHDVNNCWALGRGTFNKTNKKKINCMEADDEGSGSYKEVDDQDDPFNFNALCAINPTSPVFKSFATTVEPHPLATTESLMTRLHIEGIGTLKMEVDTAASHNIITEKCFSQLQNQLVKRGMEKSKRTSRGVKITLADGTMAPQECPVVQLRVSTDLCGFTNPLALTFLVVKGPNNLVGRHSIAKLWPTAFRDFKNNTCNNQSSNARVETKQVSGPVANQSSNARVETKQVSGPVANVVQSSNARIAKKKQD